MLFSVGDVIKEEMNIMVASSHRVSLDFRQLVIQNKLFTIIQNRDKLEQ